MKKFVVAAGLALLGAPDARAVETALIYQYLYQNIVPWIDDPVIVDAVIAQNARTRDMSAQDIMTQDMLWQASEDADSAPLIASVVTGAPADFLRAQVKASAGLITEIIVMDSVGLNVAASAATSDYWQGDEDKYRQTYPVGPDAVHITDIVLDASSQSYQAQISVTLVHPDTAEPIGAIAVGIVADALM